MIIMIDIRKQKRKNKMVQKERRKSRQSIPSAPTNYFSYILTHFIFLKRLQKNFLLSFFLASEECYRAGWGNVTREQQCL